MAKAHKGLQMGENNPFYGKKHSPETKQKMSDALKGEKHPMYGKPSWNKGKKRRIK